MFEINIETENCPLSEDFFSVCLERAAAALKEEGNFSFNVVTPKEIQDLNREYRDRDEATDVLTFRLDDGEEFPVFEGEEKELGDIFLCIEKAGENAAEFGVPLREEVLRLTVHGILHLQGWDHKSNDFKTEEMLLHQEEIVSDLKKELGI
jgi:metalloprotein, YbeY/UPF0054 family